MEFFKITFKLLSPAIITERRSRTGFLKPLKFIPASTLRGAILSALFKNGLMAREFLEGDEALSVIASYAYPITSSGEETYPCHPFIYRCKICEAHGKYAYKNYAAEVLPILERGERPNYKHVCDEGHAGLESLYSEPISPIKYNPLSGKATERREYREILTHGAICVGINRERATSERGMLYEYEAIAAGRKFWATVTLPDKFVGVLDGLEFNVGRGISRGFGRVRITNVESIDLQSVVNRIPTASTSGRVVLYALSPLLSCMGDKYSPYPKEVNLSEVAKRASLDAHGRVALESVYGKSDFHVGGWDMLSNMEKPVLDHATSPGAVVVAKFMGDMKALAVLRFLGTIEYSYDSYIVGVNMLTPLRGHPMMGVE
jgi:CRISPR/Cas system CSM-associated protein Csm3 (group 7 of RAMP superfamily)